MQLRPYQQAAVDAIYTALRSGVRAPLAVLPTGAGKSAVVGTLCIDAVQRWSGRVLVLVHVKELVEQLHDTIRKIWGPYAPLGVYSAGLRSRQVETITVAGIQSVYKKATQIGKINLVIIDEAHLLPPDGEGMYRTLLSDLAIINPSMRVVGLTATPYRMTHGLIAGEGNIFSEIVSNAKVKDLIAQGYLSPLVGKDGGAPDVGAVHTRGGEFIASELEACMSDEAKVSAAVAEILRHSGDRRALLVFCCGVKHAGMVSSALSEAGVENEIITGSTKNAERDELISAYKSKRLRCLVNVNVLTTGFDAPHVDMVVLLRPTQSPGLYYQMVGRGLRKADGKANCLVLDLAGNIARHGPIDEINERIIDNDGKGGGAGPVKTCPACATICPAGCGACPDCGEEFKKMCSSCGAENEWSAQVCCECGKSMYETAKHDTRAADGDPIHGASEWYGVDGIEYSEHHKRDAPPGHPATLRVDYYQGMHILASEWVCVEHSGGYAKQKAVDWLRDRGIDYDSSMTAESIAKESHKIKVPYRVCVAPDGKYKRIIGYDFTEPEPGADIGEPSWVGELCDDDVPF